MKTGTILGTHSGISNIDTSSGLKALSKGISDIGRAAENIADTQLALDAKNANQKKSTNVAKAHSKLRLDWTKQFMEHQKNPSEDSMSIIEKQYDDYVNQTLDGFETPEEAEAYQIHADSYKVGLLQKSQLLQQHTRAQNFGQSLDLMISDAEEAIYQSKSLEEAIAQEDMLIDFITQARANDRIRDPETVEKLKQKAEQLSYTWALSVVDDEPDAVLVALKQESLMKSVSIERREALKKRAEVSLKEKDEYDKIALRQIFNNDKTQRRTTGEKGVFSYEDSALAFGKTTADIMKHDLELSSKLYAVDVESQGAYTEDLLAMRERNAPVVGSPTFEMDKEFYEEVSKIATQRQKQKLNDPYTYFAQNSGLASLVKTAADNPENMELQLGVQEAVLGAQKRDGAISPSNYAVMPKAGAQRFIENFNTLLAVGSKADGPGVRDQLTGFYEMFGQNTQVAFRQLNNLTGGEKVTSKINPLLWHLDNPSSFNLIFESIKKPLEDQKKRFTSEQLTEYNEEFITDANLLNYTASVVTSDNSSQSFNIVNGVREAFNSFSLDYVANGGKQEEASSIFFERYTFGEANGATYARPNSYQDDKGETQYVTPDMAELSDEWLDIELTDMVRKIANPRNVWDNSSKSLQMESVDIDPKTVLPQVFEGNLQEDLADALESNAFWVTNEDETGVYLYVKGQFAGAPVQVKRTDGSNVEVSFNQTYVGRNHVNRKTVLGGRTDDTIWDKFGKAMGNMR